MSSKPRPAIWTMTTGPGTANTAGVKVMPLMALLVALGLWQARRPRQVAFFFLSVAGAAGIMQFVKQVMQRARPAL